jgi:hypothetical protein
VTIVLTGTGVIPGSLKLSAKSIEFGSTPVGTSVTKSISVSNSGQTSINNVHYVVADDHAVQFSRVMGGKDDCATTIAPGMSCELSVSFLASKRGTFAGTITLLPDGQDALSATLGGVALGPAILKGDLTEIAFPGQEVGIASTISKTWTITNIGDRTATTAPIVASTNPDEFPLTHTCKDPLPPNSTCTVSIQFKPKEGAVRQGAINVTTDGSTLNLPLSGPGLFRLTINKIVGGADCATCAVKSGEDARLIDCGGTCSALFERGAQVKLQATTTNGSGHWFSGWSGDATTSCVGPLRSCEVTIGSSLTLGATFSAMTNNLIFYSSTEHAADAGSATKYDQICNTLASNAGINNASKNGYVAWVSDANSLATQRVFHSPTIQGWVRMDGRVFAVNRNELLSKDGVVNPVAFDENGLMDNKRIFTGTNNDGTLNPELNCKNWTSNSPNDSILGGTAQSGPRSWSAGWYGPSCATGLGVLCLGNTSSSPVTLTMTAGKKIWTTAKPFFPGSGITPDDWCVRNIPAGVSEVKALVARTNSAAASVLSASTIYVRLDGQRVGTGAALIKTGNYNVADSYLETGIWQDNLGAYTTTSLGRVWTGAPTIDAVGTVESTCGNWSDATKTGGMVGQNTCANNSFFRFTTQSCTPAHFYEGVLYCVEQ